MRPSRCRLSTPTNPRGHKGQEFLRNEATKYFGINQDALYFAA